jgi:hypothetical protein
LDAAADGAADVDVDVELELADELLLPLLPHAATVTTHGNKSAASTNFLQENIRLLLVRNPK